MIELAFCGKCGNFIKSNHKFCAKCGSVLPKINNKNKSQKKPTQNNYQLRPSLDIEKLEQKIHNLTNHERQKRHLTQLSYDTHIQDISRLHSQDMSVRNYFEHTNPDGQEPFDRAASANFDFQKQSNDPNTMKKLLKMVSPKPFSSEYAYGENLYQTNLANKIISVNGVPTHYEWEDEDHLAEIIVDGWMHSKDHYENIVKPEWQREGIGVYVANDDKVFATQNFHFCILNQVPSTNSQPPKINPIQINKKQTKKRRKKQNTSQNSTTSPGTTIGVPANVLVYTGRRTGKYIEKQFFDAKKSAYVCSPWISTSYVEKMVLMANQGIDIKIITQEENLGMKDTIDLIRNASSYPGVQKANVKRHFHYRILPAKMAGFVHVKQYIVDGDYAVSGSANFSKTGLWNNHESITIYQGMSNAQVIEDQFDRIWNSTKTA